MSEKHSTARRLRAIIYARCTTPRQEDSPGRQFAQCVPHCEARGYELVLDPRGMADYPYLDFGLKGDRDDRPGLERVIRDARAGKFDVVVCDEWSRLSRQEEDDFVAEVRRPLRRAGVCLDTIKEGLQDWDSVAGKIMSVINQEKASDEPKKIAHRVHSNARKRVAEGRPAGGGAPFGYRWEYETRMVGNRPKLAPVLLVPDANAEVVQEMFRLYASGTESILTLVVWLESRGVPPPRARKRGKKRWATSSVRKVLGNDVYTGRYDYGRQTASRHTQVSEDGVVVPRKGLPQEGEPHIRDNPPEAWVLSPIRHEALVSQELFDRVQARLQANVDGRNAKCREGYALTGILVCQHCGRSLIGHRQIVGSKKRRDLRRGELEYRCPSYLQGDLDLPCTNARVNQRVVLDAVLDKLERDFLNERVFEQMRRDLEARVQEEARPANLARLQKAADALDAQVRKARGNLVLLEADEIAEARERIRELEVQRDALAAQVEELAGGSRLDQFEELLEGIRALAPRLAEVRRCLRMTPGEEHFLSADVNAILRSFTPFVGVTWDMRRPKTGNQNYMRRPPVGGVIYLHPYFERFLALVSPEACGPVEVYTLPGDLTEGQALSKIVAAVGERYRRMVRDASTKHKGSPLCAPEVTRILGIPFSISLPN